MHRERATELAIAAGRCFFQEPQELSTAGASQSGDVERVRFGRWLRPALLRLEREGKALI